ncbi:MAG: cobalt-precorrin 5A hydrolase [Oscillospiraceae bacterium]|nr:cobalt-precorrin 5A hydrolase [Oscillospiraceae bacterium]
MTLRLIAFSGRGLRLARTLADGLGGEAVRGGENVSLSDWTARAFEQAEGLIFVGSVGIAVRAIAPHVRHKTADPAVVVVDESGRWAIPILSGHLGGANDLARRAAALCGAVPVITTATDINGVFAVDEWARRQNCAVVNPERIKRVSARLLAGGWVSFCSDWPISGRLPEGVAPGAPETCDFYLTARRQAGAALFVVPRVAVLGVGCKKGISREAVEDAFSALLRQAGLWEQAVAGVCSIDLKREEPGILEFCRAHGFPFQTYSARELRETGDGFTASAFVEAAAGVDNVCERSAVLGSGGRLLQKKLAMNGVTMAAALKPFSPDWRWRHE